MKELFQNLANQTKDIKNNLFLVDVRTSDEFASGSVEGAINIPLSDIVFEYDQFENKNNIVVFCRSGIRSGQAQMLLTQNGFKNVINGGSWQNVQKELNKALLK